MASIKDYRKEAILNKKIRYDEGIMTRQEWLKLMNVKGWQSEERQRRNYAAEDKLSEWLSKERVNVPLGNPNYPTTKHYLEEKKRLEAGIFKTEYVIKNGNSVYDLTKTEYEYFTNIQLAEDIATEKQELNQKIEAGIASEDEVNAAMQKEFDFAAKYFEP